MTDIRISLTDKTIAQLPAPKEGWYLARDAELKGFFVVIGKRRRTFTVQGDLRQGGKRASSIRVSIGDASEISTRAARAIAKEYLAQISRGRHPKDEKRAEGTTAAPAAGSGQTLADITLRQAWQRYVEAHLIRKNRSEKTKLLMNHAIPGVNAGYIKLLEDHLRGQQQAISSAVFAAVSASIAQNHELHGWLGRGAYRRATRGTVPGGKQGVVRPVAKMEQGSI